MNIGVILFQVLALFMALTFHEFAHAWVARKLGDKTAEYQGRLTLNPKDHIDPFGTILVPALLILMKSPVVFGWAKPVPINPMYFKNPRKGMMWSALAGPLINLFLAGILTIASFYSTSKGKQSPSGVNSTPAPAGSDNLLAETEEVKWLKSCQTLSKYASSGIRR